LPPHFLYITLSHTHTHQCFLSTPRERNIYKYGKKYHKREEPSLSRKCHLPVIYRTFEALERQGSDLFGGARKVVLVRACIVRCREREIYGERR
jgi:hypothetical protein